MSILHPFTWFTYNRRGVLPPPDGTPADPIPVGAVTMLVSSSVGVPSVPYGWLLCNGGSHPTASYPELAALVASPAAPGVNFTVPNMASRVPVGAGTRPLKSVGGSAHSASLHVNNSTHSHTNEHWHSVSSHSHKYNHAHKELSSHTHSEGSYVIEPQVSKTLVDTNGSPVLQAGALGADSAKPHYHTIDPLNRTEGASSEVLFSMRNDLVTDAASSGNSDTQSTNLNQKTIPLSTDSNLLPPYLNVYFIVKAIDFTGEYT